MISRAQTPDEKRAQDAHNLQSRALLALVMADGDAVTKFTADFQDTNAYVEQWLREQGHTAERAAWLAPYLRVVASTMTLSGAVRDAVAERHGPPRTEL